MLDGTAVDFNVPAVDAARVCYCPVVDRVRGKRWCSAEEGRPRRHFWLDDKGTVWLCTT